MEHKYAMISSLDYLKTFPNQLNIDERSLEK